VKGKMWSCTPVLN